jgi:hypothetical protein
MNRPFGSQPASWTIPTATLRAGALLLAILTAWVCGSKAVEAQSNPVVQEKDGSKPLAIKKSAAKKKKPVEETTILREAGELTAADPFDRLRGQTHHKVYPVKMAPGKTYVIRLYDQNAGGSNMDPYLRLEDSRGINLAQDDDGEGNLNSRIEFNPPREEMYRVIATTLSPRRLGKYLLTVDAFPPGRVPPRGASMGMYHTMATGNPLVPGLPSRVGDLEIRCWTWGQSVNQGNMTESHGYIEYRFTIENRSDTQGHRVTLIMPSQRFSGTPMGRYVHQLRKTVDVGPAASMQVSLFQPDLPMRYGQLVDVEIDGRLDEQRVGFSTIGNRGNRSGSGRFYGGGGGPTPTLSLLTTPALYSGYVQQHHKKAGALLRQIHAQQGPEDLRQWSTHWLGYSSFDTVIAPWPQLQAAPDVQAALWQYVECGGTLVVVGPAKLPESWDRAKTQFAGFTAYYPGFGQCLVAGEPFAKWTPEQWEGLAETWSSASVAWSQINSATDANRILPVVEDLSIPVQGLFIVMILFVVLIGPVNVYWLSRIKRRMWLLWTVPVCAILTCLLLVGYMVATEGWDGYARSTSITVLDENAQRAATIGWQGYYCPTTPGGGLRFDFDTELTPHLDFRAPYAYRRAAQPCSVDWTDDQHLAEGWITAKVPLHFMVRRGEKRLERLTLRKNPDDTLAATNGLGADIKSLWLARTDGALLSAHDVAAGATVTLTPTDQKSQGEVGNLSDVFAANWVQQAEALGKSPAEYLRPGCYLAVLDGSPFLDQGLRRTQSRRMNSVVIGILKEPF